MFWCPLNKLLYYLPCTKDHINTSPTLPKPTLGVQQHLLCHLLQPLLYDLHKQLSTNVEQTDPSPIVTHRKITLLQNRDNEGIPPLLRAGETAASSAPEEKAHTPCTSPAKLHFCRQPCHPSKHSRPEGSNFLRVVTLLLLPSTVLMKRCPY